MFLGDTWNPSSPGFSHCGPTLSYLSSNGKTKAASASSSVRELRESLFSRSFSRLLEDAGKSSLEPVLVAGWAERNVRSPSQQKF